MPTSTISGYDGYFAVFAKFDTDNSANSSALAAVQEIFSGSHYETYEVFYTGVSSDALTLHVILSTDLTEDAEYNATAETYGGEKIYKATGADLVSLNRHTIRVPVTENGKRAATITRITVK